VKSFRVDPADDEAIALTSLAILFNPAFREAYCEMESFNKLNVAISIFLTIFMFIE